MTRTYRCSRGHEWSVPGDAPTEVNGPGDVCPVCGGGPSSSHSTIHWPAPSSAEGAETPPAVSGYEILTELGRGGTGVVYQARHQESGQVVAVKVIRSDRLANPEVVQRFRREAQAAARLTHPNIVRVYESDQEGDLHFLAMEYVPGETLQRMVERTGPLPVAAACDFIRQTAQGLQHAAEQSLVHRDIKPSNLMVVAGTGRGGRGVVKILDMGVAKLLESRQFHEESLTTLTRDGAVVGTPDYIAPEQLEDPHGADIRADLYSLGCTFYFLLSGGVPFPGGSLIQKLDRQRWETPLSVDQIRREVPSPVAAVIRRLMAKHPDDRFQTPGELADALGQLSRTGKLPAAHQAVPLVQRAVWTNPGGPVTCLALVGGGRQLAVAGPDRLVRLLDAASGREIARVGQGPYPTTALAVHPAAGHVLAAQGATVRVWDAASGKEVQRLTGHTDTVRGITVTPDGQYAVTAGDDRTVRTWDLPAGRELHRAAGFRTRFTCVVGSPDGARFATGSQDDAIRLWQLHGPREPDLLQGPKSASLALAFGEGGRLLVSGHFDTTVRLWDLATGRETRCFQGHRQMVSCVGILPDGVVVSGGHDNAVRFWDPGSGAELSCGQGHTQPVTALAVTEGGAEVWTAGYDGTLRLWHLPE